MVVVLFTYPVLTLTFQLQNLIIIGFLLVMTLMRLVVEQSTLKVKEHGLNLQTSTTVALMRVE